MPRNRVVDSVGFGAVLPDARTRDDPNEVRPISTEDVGNAWSGPIVGEGWR